jgi:predicted ATP-binding protein involved in virulence
MSVIGELLGVLVMMALIFGWGLVFGKAETSPKERANSRYTKGPGTITIIIGDNGSGKTRALKHLHKQVSGSVFLGIDRMNRFPRFPGSDGQKNAAIIAEVIRKAKDRTLILIDEPELSMHIAWQQKFIRLIEPVAIARNLHFVIATHSPDIIYDRWDLVEDLSKMTPTKGDTDGDVVMM